MKTMAYLSKGENSSLGNPAIETRVSGLWQGIGCGETSTIFATSAKNQSLSPEYLTLDNDCSTGPFSKRQLRALNRVSIVSYCAAHVSSLVFVSKQPSSSR
jgi:hypothetical protein